MTDSAWDYARRLRVAEPLRAPLMRKAIASLRLPRGSRGVDAGCGAGLQLPLLAGAVGLDGHVTGVDRSAELIAVAARHVAERDLEPRVDLVHADIEELPFADRTLGWLWSAECAGYPTTRPETLVAELARVVEPGGIIAILVWSSQVLLPGHPALEARLNATAAGTAPFTAEMAAEHHHLRALGWLRRAGLVEARARTFVRDVGAPLGTALRNALAELFAMRWGGAEDELTEEERNAYRRLCSPDSPACILDDPGFVAFFTETLFSGRVAAR